MREASMPVSGVAAGVALTLVGQTMVTTEPVYTSPPIWGWIGMIFLILIWIALLLAPTVMPRPP